MYCVGCGGPLSDHEGKDWISENWCFDCVVGGAYMGMANYDSKTGSHLYFTCAGCDERHYGLDYLCGDCRKHSG
jgi:hypothetical protein